MTNHSRRVAELKKRSSDFEPIVVVLKPDEPIPSWASDPHVLLIKHVIIDSPLRSPILKGVSQ